MVIGKKCYNCKYIIFREQKTYFLGKFDLSIFSTRVFLIHKTIWRTKTRNLNKKQLQRSPFVMEGGSEIVKALGLRSFYETIIRDWSHPYWTFSVHAIQARLFIRVCYRFNYIEFTSKTSTRSNGCEVLGILWNIGSGFVTVNDSASRSVRQRSSIAKWRFLRCEFLPIFCL